MIYNAPSIYKQGGGGGGFKDGGALVDGDFIKVENNTVSTYTNETRNDVNFYFEIKEGEIINSVIEFTTDVNATIHVYYIGAGGILIPLGNVGGDTVTAGESYNINVVGNSFVLENIIEPVPDPDDIFVYNSMDSKVYNCKKVNGIYWSTTDYLNYVKFNDYNIQSPWRVPSKEDFYTLKNNNAIETIAKPNTWNSKVSPAPTNTTGLGFAGLGYKETKNGEVKGNEMNTSWWQNKNLGGVNSFNMRIFQSMWDPNNCYWDNYSDSSFMNQDFYCHVRLIYDP